MGIRLSSLPIIKSNSSPDKPYKETIMTSKSAKNGIIKKDIDLPGVNDKGKLAFILLNVFTEAECKTYIDLSEAKGYKPALVNVGMGYERAMPDFRNSDRCIIDSFEMAGEIWQRIKLYIPEEWHPNRKVIGLNERLRFLRYDVGQKFEAHMDGCYQRQDGSFEMSFITIQIYLNEGFKGGATTFIDPDGINPSVKCVPKTGMVLVFEHRLLHEGSRLIKGRKYAIRTDVMYKRKELLDENEN
ncbi:unnamed protein product [Didymodactylos carnosus]|uniref:Prolyl 4-hydroxylase alpha subunit domain-containing protein n=1 Tax=Didymodactylos carnosus TaxID=1234261 RepID=A0A815WF62_9BILA|nr:unnamed protein product [Didymodactylos carnosus]CAF1546999.1 unnamed protein product [Didymodactylos carnosus]CAF4177674.1 unnamed protein product [Didymodactylos carnosus]CAF4407809.1 unnamed protein product [Didymodactylos carnosus]